MLGSYAVGMGVLAAPVWTFWLGVVIVLFVVIPVLLTIIVGYVKLVVQTRYPKKSE